MASRRSALEPALGVTRYPRDRRRPVELGRYEAAEPTLQRMLDRKPNSSSYSRVSYFRELNGDSRGAVQAMRLAVSAGGGAPRTCAYVQTLLGDLELQRGRRCGARWPTAWRSPGGPGYPPA